MAGVSRADREEEAREVARWEKRMEVEEEKLREACTRVAMKAVRHLEDGYDRAKELYEEAIENLQRTDLTPHERNSQMLEFSRYFNKMCDVSSRLVSVAMARVKRSAEPDERFGWTQLVDELKGVRKRLPAPMEIVVKSDKGEREAG